MNDNTNSPAQPPPPQRGLLYSPIKLQVAIIIVVGSVHLLVADLREGSCPHVARPVKKAVQVGRVRVAPDRAKLHHRISLARPQPSHKVWGYNYTNYLFVSAPRAKTLCWRRASIYRISSDRNRGTKRIGDQCVFSIRKVVTNV